MRASQPPALSRRPDAARVPQSKYFRATLVAASRVSSTGVTSPESPHGDIAQKHQFAPRLVWRFRSPHHFCRLLVTRTSETKATLDRYVASAPLIPKFANQ